MAEQRIKSYHRQDENGKKEQRRDLSVVLEEDESERKSRSMKPFVTKSKDATVEVIVKVKKRRDKHADVERKKLIPIPENGFRKGSWGDLLMRNSKTALARKDGVEEKHKKSESSKSKRVASASDCGQHVEGCFKEHSPLCQKIPITDKLYLETHTHVRRIRPLMIDEEVQSTSSLKRISSTSTTASARHAALLRENEELWHEVERLRQEMEDSKARRFEPSDFELQRVTKATSAPVVVKERSFSSKYGGQTQGTQTSHECVRSPSTKNVTDISHIDGNHRSPPKTVQQSSSTKISTAVGTADVSQLDNLRLERENEALRREATELLTQVNKARADYLECYNTMKELYQIAANLKQENNNLAQSQQQQQTMQAKLLQALAENREIKAILETLMNKPVSASSPRIGEDQLLQVRNVIQDVKHTIAQEMKVLEMRSKARTDPALRAEKDSNLNSAFRHEESLLNDTNASEIQHIFSSHPEMRRGLALEDRSSSTQYMTLGGISNPDSHYRPSPCAAEKFSPRISTPNSSDVSVTLSEAAEAAGVNSFRPIEKAPVTSGKIGNPDSETSDLSVDDNTDNEWKRLEVELAKSFTSVRNHLSNQSTSSYSSSGSSSSSSPNPIRRK